MITNRLALRIRIRSCVHFCSCESTHDGLGSLGLPLSEAHKKRSQAFMHWEQTSPPIYIRERFLLPSLSERDGEVVVDECMD